MNEVAQVCSICRRKLDVEGDPLSDNCGGDCWGCIGEIEAEGGYEPSLEQVRKEFSLGYRPNWVPAPIVKMSIKDKGFINSTVNVQIKLKDQLGKPWKNKSVAVRVIFKTLDGRMEKKELNSYDETTDHSGEINLEISIPKFHLGKLWIDTIYTERTWSFPIT